MILPVKKEDGAIVTQTYEHHKIHQPKGSWGTDISTTLKKSVPIYNCFNGIVMVSGKSITFGNRIWIKITDIDCNYYFRYIVYPHLFEIAEEIKVGVALKEGDVLGMMGNTGLVLNKKTNLVENNNDGHILLPDSMHIHLECRLRMDDGMSSIFLKEIEEETLKK